MHRLFRLQCVYALGHGARHFPLCARSVRHSTSGVCCQSPPVICTL